jgi:N-acetylglucosaminyldiphosphoundecaprenol N-acetyl-beta-D-mannosaminyltransferase
MADFKLCERVSILGTPLSLCDKAGLLATIAEAVVAHRRLTVLSGNIYSYNLAYEKPWLRAFFNQADIVRLDGAGVRLGARLLGYATPPRMTWADFGWDLAELAAREGLTLFLLGSKPGIAEKAAAKFKERYPNVAIVGTHHGYFDKTLDSAENQGVLQIIADAKPDILIVGFGMPLQERWLSETRDLLAATVVLTGGAVFDYISGELHRGPQWMTDHGLEWLARLLIEPRRLWKRYIIGNPLFLWRVLKQKLGLLHLPE